MLLSVANRRDSGHQIGFSISRIGLLVSYQVIDIFVAPLLNPQAEAKNTSVLTSLGKNLSDLLTHSVCC